MRDLHKSNGQPNNTAPHELLGSLELLDGFHLGIFEIGFLLHGGFVLTEQLGNFILNDFQGILNNGSHQRPVYTRWIPMKPSAQQSLSTSHNLKILATIVNQEFFSCKHVHTYEGQFSPQKFAIYTSCVALNKFEDLGLDVFSTKNRILKISREVFVVPSVSHVHKWTTFDWKQE